MDEKCKYSRQKSSWLITYCVQKATTSYNMEGVFAPNCVWGWAIWRHIVIKIGKPIFDNNFTQDRPRKVPEEVLLLDRVLLTNTHSMFIVQVRMGSRRLCGRFGVRKWVFSLVHSNIWLIIRYLMSEFSIYKYVAEN